MSISHILEDFGGVLRGTPVELTDVSLEEQRLEAFEKGYQAGWDDSVKAQAEDSRRISADFAQNLQDLDFTYQEAYSAVLASMKPLLHQMVNAVLPELSRETLGQKLADVLHEMAQGHGPGTVEIVTAPDNLPALEALLENTPEMTATVTEDATLAAGQVYIRHGTEEREIDTESVLRIVRQRVGDFLDENLKEQA